MKNNFDKARLGLARCGDVRNGKARFGLAGCGRERCGTVWPGKEW